MYIDNIYVNYVAAGNNVNESPYQPIVSTEVENDSFYNILTDTINETSCPVIPEPPAEEDPDENVIPMDSIPPVIKTEEPEEPDNVNNIIPIESATPVVTATTETAASSYLNQYYKVHEGEVLQGLSNVRFIINNTNLAGKTDREKYEFIENKFIDAFGKDFMMARDLSLPSSMFYLIGVEFSDTLARHIDNPEQVNRERLYGDKSTSSVQDTIRNKYPSELTNRDMFLMVNEMRNAGVLDSASLRTIGMDGAKRLVDTLALMRSYARFISRDANNLIKPLSAEERDEKLLSLFNKLLDTSELFILHNEWKGSGRIAIGEDTAPLFVKYLGGELDENGFFKLGKSNYGYDMTQIFDLLMSEMHEYDDMVRDRMKMIDSIPPMFMIAPPVAEEEPPVEEVPGAEENLETDEVTEAGESESTGAEEFSGAGAEENTESNDEAA